MDTTKNKQESVKAGLEPIGFEFFDQFVSRIQEVAIDRERDRGNLAFKAAGICLLESSKLLAEQGKKLLSNSRMTTK